MHAEALTPFSRALAIQGRVIGALLMREVITRFGRRNIGFLWLFVEPALFVLAVVALWSATKSVHGSALPIVPFALTGYAGFFLWRNVINRGATAVAPNLALLFHRNVRVLDLYFARFLLEICGGTIAFAVLYAAFMAVGWMMWPDDVLKIAIGWAMLAWSGIGLGLIFGALSQRSRVMDRIRSTLVYLFLPLSGAVFMVEWLPRATQEIVLWVPMVHATELIREGYFGAMVRSHYSISYVITANLVLTLLGLALVRGAGKRHAD
jgi:capsular polysaccharide transport system permease protein